MRPLSGTVSCHFHQVRASGAVLNMWPAQEQSFPLSGPLLYLTAYLDAALARALTCARNDSPRHSSFSAELPTKQTS
jgi:hypothetical protein